MLLKGQVMSMPNHFADIVRSRVFSIAFWIVIFMSTVGLADLFVSDRKKRAVQDWFETLTLKMSDIDSTKWPSCVSTKRGSRYVAASSLLPTVALIPIAIHRTLATHRPIANIHNNQVILSFYVLIALIILTTIVFGVSILTLRICGQRLLKLLVGDGSFISFAVKALFVGTPVMIIIFVLNFRLLLVMISIARHVDVHSFLLAVVAVLAISSIMMALHSLFLMIVLGLFLAHALPVLAFIVGQFTALCWRIVEYKQGALRAIILLLAAFLGICKAIIGQ
jgi:hypothetical protein